MGFNETLPAGRLPETDVEGMRQFLSMLFTPKPHNNFFAQFYAGIATTSFLSVLALTTLIRRLRSQSAWIVQLYHTPRGTFVIPNAVMTLVIFLFLFTLMFIPYALLSISFYRGHTRYQKDYHFWRHFPWFLLWCAAFLSSGGTISAFPDALRQRGKEIGLLQRWFLRPGFFHSVLIFAPLMCFGTLIGPIILCAKQFNSLLPRYREWQAEAANPSANVAELAAEARSLWLGITKVYYLDGIVFTMWFAWGGILFILFASVAVHTLLRVRTQVKLAKKKKEALSRTQPTFYLFSSRPNYGRSHDHDEHAEIASPTDGRGMFSSADGPSSPKQAVKFNREAGQQRIDRRDELAPDLVEVMQTETQSVMFPALKFKPNEKLTKVQAAVRRSTALNLVYRNLLVQYAAIGLGIGAFSILALYSAITSYPTSRNTDMGVWHEAGNLLALYITMIFGFCVVGAVLWRSFDPAFTLAADSQDAEEEFELPETVSGTREKSLNEAPSHMGDTSDSTVALGRAESAATQEATSRENLLPYKAPQPPAFAARIGAGAPPSRPPTTTPPASPASPRARILAGIASDPSVAAESSPNRSRYGAWREVAT